MNNTESVSSWCQSSACAALKLDKASCWLDGQRFGPGKSKSNELAKVVKDCSKLAEEQLKGLTNQVVKNALFNKPLQSISAAQVLEGASGLQ
jgi:hypothetical protein